MARLSFRAKCNNQFRGIRSPGVLSAFLKQAFFMECACSYELYMIKWQAILLRCCPFPPQAYERITFGPGVASLPLFYIIGQYVTLICGNRVSMIFRGSRREDMMEMQPWEDKEYSFFSHRKCECFPCHEGADPENFNCLFCYCPLYALGRDCGGGFRITEKGLKDCSQCQLPHKRENYGYVTGKYEDLVKRMKKIEEQS